MARNLLKNINTTPESQRKFFGPAFDLIQQQKEPQLIIARSSIVPIVSRVPTTDIWAKEIDISHANIKNLFPKVDQEEAKIVAPKLRLMIKSLKCEDETNPEWPGDDEIAIGGNYISLGDGTTNNPPKSNKVNLGEYDSFSDGVVKQINREFARWSLSDGGNTWPKTFSALLNIAEIDNGGWSNYLSDIYDKMAEEIKKKDYCSNHSNTECLYWPISCKYYC